MRAARLKLLSRPPLHLFQEVPGHRLAKPSGVQEADDPVIGGVARVERVEEVPERAELLVGTKRPAPDPLQLLAEEIQALEEQGDVHLLLALEVGS